MKVGKLFPKLLLAIFALVWLMPASANAQVQDTVFDGMNKRREQILNHGSIALASIAAFNVATTVVFMNQEDPSLQSVGNLNIVWNSGNILLATFGYFRSRAAYTKNIDEYESMSRARLVENMYCFSLGLDCSYIATSLRLMQEANTSDTNVELRRSFAWFFMFQGLAYIALDGTCLYSHYRNWKGSKHLINRLQPANNGVGLMLKF